MKIEETNLFGVYIIKPTIYEDERGFFLETYNKKRYQEFGIPDIFVQDNHSRSTKGVLRGLHFQNKNPQGKLVSCSRGSVYDVAVDINPDSANYGKYFGIELSENNKYQLWIPPGYAHGFCVLSDVADFQYKCTDYFYPDDQGGIIWNDPDIKIDWPFDNPVLSDKDILNPTLHDFNK